MRGRVLLLSLLFVLALAPAGKAQIHSCGDMELFIANPDLRTTASDGKYHVAGDFFMQFQVQGNGASNVETFAFSVGLPVDNPEEFCTAPVWPGGLMLEAYKADFDKEDGFFILMNTAGSSTPQNTALSVAVHAYDANDNELARFWTQAIVENCAGPLAIPDGCSDADVIAHDRIQPWPVILPGDGSEEPVDGVAIEFGEPLQPIAYAEDGVTTLPGSGLRVFLNNDDITAQLTEWTSRPLWDRDAFYDYGPRGSVATLAPPCSSPEYDGVKNCGYADGPALQWAQRAMTPDDVVRVEAIDLAGNVAIKEIHMAQAQAGGTLEGGIPLLEMSFKEHTLAGAPGETLVYHMTMTNTGSGEGHPFSDWQASDYPTGWAEPVWEPGHEPVPPKGTSEQELHVTIPADAFEGSFKVNARMDYKQAGVDKSTISTLTAIVEVPADAAPQDEASEPKDSPGLGIIVLVGLLGLVGARRSRA